MPEVVVTRDIFEKYQTNGKLRLSTGYIQEIFETEGNPGRDGVVQILKGRQDMGTLGGYEYCYRIRVCDGVFQYNCLISTDVAHKIDEQKEHLVEGTIIALTDFCLTDGDGKPSLVIKNYKLLSRYHQILAHPDIKARSHSGSRDEHRGYRPSVVIEDDWAEAEEFLNESRENMANPPAAKMAKTENAPPQRAAPPPVARKASSKAESGIIPIAAITPYITNIKIHGMVTRKDELKILAAKNMKIFNFEVTDALGDCIRLTAFNDTAESMSTTIMDNMSYYITGGSVRVANKRFNNTGHDYEITLRNDSKVEPGGEIFTAPKLNVKRVELSKISAHIGNLIDVMVVVERIDENYTEFTSKQGKEFVKREMDVIDESAFQARVTLWGDEARNVDHSLVGQVVVIKGVSPREFNGAYSLSTGSSTRMYPSPDLQGVPELYDWFDKVRPNAEIKMMSQSTSGSSSEAPRTIAGVKEMRFGNDSEKGDYATLKAMITRINAGTALYKGCPNDGCQKKVVDSDSEYRCEKCNMSGPTFKYLYMMQFEISDETGQVYVTAFGDTAAKIVGKSAAEMGALREANENSYNAVFDQLQFKPKLWRVRCKMETYNEEVKQRLTVFSVDDVNQEKYISHLEELIKQLEEIQN